MNFDVGGSVSGDEEELVGSGDFVLALVIICSFSIMLISGAVDPVIGLAEIVVLGLEDSSVIVSIDEYLSEAVDPLDEDPIVDPCVVDLLRLVESKAIVELKELVDFPEVSDPRNMYWLVAEDSVDSLGVDGSVLVGLWVVSRPSIVDPSIAVRKNSLVDFPLSKVENPDALENSDPIVVDTAIAPIVLSNSDEEAIAFVDIKELVDPSGNSDDTVVDPAVEISSIMTDPENVIGFVDLNEDPPRVVADEGDSVDPSVVVTSFAAIWQA